jgi:hypothetical protein
MTVHPRRAGVLCALILAVIAAFSMAAQAARKRPVAHPSSTKITVSGTVTDAITGLPLKGVSISTSEGGAATDDTGHFTLSASRGTTLTAARVGYVSAQKPASDTVNFALAQTPSVTVKTTAGDTVVFDSASVKFGYVNTFRYDTSDGLNLCKSGDPQWQVPTTNLQKITGPAHSVTQSACCDRGPVMAIDVVTKSGDNTTAYLNDSCFGFVVDILGIERTSATPKYIHLSDVAEVTFP